MSDKFRIQYFSKSLSNLVCNLTHNSIFYQTETYMLNNKENNYGRSVTKYDVYLL